ncbi:unnamed protein product [Effrenium voratum]|nr:unnamed protein product [Effrenium voratum]
MDSFRPGLGIQSLQQRLAEVRAQRQAGLEARAPLGSKAPPLPELGAPRGPREPELEAKAERGHEVQKTSDVEGARSALLETAHEVRLSEAPFDKASQPVDRSPNREASPREPVSWLRRVDGRAPLDESLENGSVDEARMSASDMDSLRSENHLLTEKLVEASLQSAKHFEALSSNRDELRRQLQELRTQLETEKAHRSNCEERLASAEEILGQLAEENRRLMEPGVQPIRDAKAPELEALSPASLSDLRQADRDVLWRAHVSLRQKMQKLQEENEQLRAVAIQRTEEANATVLELAQRNKLLEERLAAQGRGTTTPRAGNQAGSRNSSRSVPRSGAFTVRREEPERKPELERKSSVQSLPDRRTCRRSASRENLSPQASLRARAAMLQRTPQDQRSKRPTKDDLQSSLNRLAEEMRRFQEKVVQYNDD